MPRKHTCFGCMNMKKRRKQGRSSWKEDNIRSGCSAERRRTAGSYTGILREKIWASGWLRLQKPVMTLQSSG